MITWRDGLQYNGGLPRSVRDALTVEAPLQILINGEPFTITMRTPGEDPALARGLLHTEGLIEDPAAPIAMEEDPGEVGRAGRVHVTVEGKWLVRDFAHRRSVLSTSSCGLCGKKELDDVEMGPCPIRLAPARRLPVEGIGPMLDTMRRAQETFERSGGSHAAAVLTVEGGLLALSEDIGRHNAVDKAVGRLLLDGQLARAEVLLVSGRLSYEIVYKAWRAGIVHLLSVSAPSNLAVETGGRLGMTIAGFCREGRATIYTHPENVTGAPAPTSLKAES